MHTDTLTDPEAAYRAEWCAGCGTAPCAGTCPDAVADRRSEALDAIDEARMAAWS